MCGDAAPHVVEDFLGAIQILSDGRAIRGANAALQPAPEPFPDVPGVQWKDVVYHATRGLRVRMFRPSAATANAGEAVGGKLPVLIYFHGGGYCVGAYDEPNVQAFCLRLASELPALVLSVQYRLAPEHRLPAAIDDGAAFLSWMRGAGADPWLAESADFNRLFITGVSAGANLAHHVVVQVASGRLALDPVRVAGYVLLSAWFGAAERVATEADPPADVSLTVEMSDQLWRMALPAGASRDHPFANPFGPESAGLAPVALPPVLVVAPESDVLRDRVLGYAARMKEMGKDVVLAEFKGEQHGFCVLRPWSQAASELIPVLKRFVYHGDYHGAATS